MAKFVPSEIDRLIGQRIQRRRKELGFTAEKLSECVDISQPQFSRYERGELLAPKPLVVLMRLLDRHPHLLADAKVLAEGADMRGAFTYTVHNDTETLKAS